MEERGSSFDSRTHQGEDTDHDNHGYSGGCGGDASGGDGVNDHVNGYITNNTSLKWKYYKMQLLKVYNKERLVHHANYIK